MGQRWRPARLSLVRIGRPGLQPTLDTPECHRILSSLCFVRPSLLKADLATIGAVSYSSLAEGDALALLHFCASVANFSKEQLAFPKSGWLPILGDTC